MTSPPSAVHKPHRQHWRTFLYGAAVLVTAASCGRGETDPDGSTSSAKFAVTATCLSSTVRVNDLHADFREIWKGTETVDSGKQCDPALMVGVDFSTTVVPAQVGASFVPVKTDGSCGVATPATVATSVIPPVVWGTSTSDAGRAPLPATFSVLARDYISGIVSAGGPIAAGGDIVLSSMSLNGSAKQPVGLIAGGKITVANGSVSGNVTYGVQSTIAQTVSVSGSKTLQAFSAAAAFQDLASLAVLLSNETSNGTTTLTNSNLQLTGTNPSLNVFQVTAEAISQASSVQLSVPANAAAIVNVTGNTTVALLNKGISIQGATAAMVLWNIPAAAFVQIAGVAVQGSILAPRSLVTFDSGSINGTLVARAFVSSGSGSLQYTPLAVTKLLAASTPSSVRLTPAQPLVRGCNYRFIIPATAPLTAAGACLSPPVDVTFRVSGVAGSPAARELTRVEPDPVTHTLRRFTARGGINTRVDDVLARYESAIGISVSDLVPTTAGVPSPTIPGQLVTVYQQYAQGYPVAGFGYFVASEGGIFRAANGKVAPGIPAFAPPALTATAALQSALGYLKISQAPWVAKPATYHAPVGQLVVMAKRSRPTGADFALAWEFHFGAGTGISEPAGIKIDAAAGAVLAVDSGMQRVTALNSQATYAGNQVSTTVDSVYDGSGRAFNVASYRNPDQTLVSTLASGDIKAAGVLATVTGITEDAKANVLGTPQFIVDPTPATPWVATDPVEQRMATLQWALEQSNAFMQSLNLNANGVAWQNIDGAVPHQKIRINYTDSPPVPGISQVHYSGISSTPDLAQIFIYRDPGVLPFQASTIAHEYTHALIDGLRRASGLGGATGVGTLATYREAGSINEGLADLFAIAFNHAQPTARATPWYCIELDRGKGPECLRNIATPALSTDDPLGTGQSGLPPLYGDTLLGYKDFSNTPLPSCPAQDMCGAHLNSTIISHWGYVLGMGTGPGLNACNLTVAPLDADPDKAFKMALNIALLAVSSRQGLTAGGLITEATFADFRDATLQIADELVTQKLLPDDAVAKIELAWDAVGLPPLVSTSALATPANSAGVYPWATFGWPASGDGQAASSWDFQLTNGTFDTNLAYHQEAITAMSQDNRSAVLPLALPSNSADSFFWRVRPHSNLPWEVCHPVHSFVGTTEPDHVKNLRIMGELAANGVTVPPGPFDVSWDYVRGTATPDYDLMIGTRNARCAPADDITPISPTGLSSDGVTQSDHVGFVSQPRAHYFMNVLPLGPPDFSGKGTVGDCSTLEFATADLLPPTTVDIPEPQTYRDAWKQVFNWKTSGGAAKSLVTLYERDEAGKCADTAVGPPYEIDTNCDSSCDIDLTTPAVPGLPNPTGYCWDVVDVASNGSQSPPTRKELGFKTSTTQPTPGIARLSPLGLYGEVLPGDSYGKPVTFSWSTLPSYPSAPGYGFKLGRWPWHKVLTVPDPKNCIDQEQSSYRCTGTIASGSLHCTVTTSPTTVCEEDPTSETRFADTVWGASTQTVPAAQAGQGRYCWTSWPVFEDPQHPQQPWARQPEVEVSPICYTTGPARPEITVPAGMGYVVDSAGTLTGFPQQPIVGEISVAYVPNAAMKVIASDGVQVGPPCKPDPEAAPYSDYYNCSIPFTIDPQKSSTYSIEVQTFSSEVVFSADLGTPTSFLDPSTMVHDVKRTISTGTCGALGGACCPQNTCEQGLCKAGKCVDSVVTIISPPGDVTQPPETFLTFTFKDPNPPASYAVTSSDSTGYTTTTTVAAQGDGSTVQTFTIIPQFILVENQQPFVVTFCPVLANGTGKCDSRTVNAKSGNTKSKDCSQPLGAPQLLQPPASVAALCANVSDPQGKVNCMLNAQTANVCDFFPIHSAGLGIGWPAVPGATSYQIFQLGAFATNTTTYTVMSSTANVSTSLTALQPLAGTVETCGFAGYGVSVTAIDSDCGRQSSTFTGFAYQP